NGLINESKNLTDLEKRILAVLNENSRIKLKDLIKNSKSTQMQVIYTLKKLSEKGIIEKFSGLVQKTDKQIILAYAFPFTVAENHHPFRIGFRNELLKEDLHESSNDYCL